MILIDLPVETALQRARIRAGLDRIEREDVLFHDAVRRGYLAERELDPQRFVLIDGDQAQAEIQAQIVEQLSMQLAALGQRA